MKTKYNEINKKYKKLKVFETFAGIGAQHKALELIKKEFNYDYEIVATSEWDVYANIAYNAIHNSKISYKYLKKIEEIDDFLLKFDHSFDGKTIAKKTKYYL